ncbi:MAG: hypothetical protein GX603_02280 [Chloroflexi bacterium]|nr:hypothetical protein [Chloroflexota bacterium]
MKLRNKPGLTLGLFSNCHLLGHIGVGMLPVVELPFLQQGYGLSGESFRSLFCLL